MKTTMRSLFAGMLLAAVLAGCGMPSLPGTGGLSLPSFRGSGHLPEDNFAPGWRRTSKVQRYAGRTLKDYIGAQAATFRQYGINLVCVADYTYGEDTVPTLTVESYQMDKPLAASGIFHYHRGVRIRGKAMPADVGVEAVYNDRVLYFYKGYFFFKLIYTGKEGTRMDLVALAKRIAGEIPGESRPPRGFEYLAVEGVDATTGHYSPGYTFNYDFLPPAIFAKAPGAGSIAEVLLMGHFEDKAAEVTGRDHRYWLQNNGTDYGSKRTAHRRLVWWGRDPTHGRIIMTRYRSYVIGVLTPKTYEMGEAILDRVVARIGGR